MVDVNPKFLVKLSNDISWEIPNKAEVKISDNIEHLWNHDFVILSTDHEIIRNAKWEDKDKKDITIAIFLYAQSSEVPFIYHYEKEKYTDVIAIVSICPDEFLDYFQAHL